MEDLSVRAIVAKILHNDRTYECLPNREKNHVLDCFDANLKRNRSASDSTGVYKPRLTGDILIVMIGKMPDGEELMQHWLDFLKTADSSLYIVCHPRDLQDAETLQKNWSPHLHPGRFLTVDAAHHVPTAWGTISLALATLMAIQYALTQRGAIDAFQKIVFLQQDAPLYRYDVIKREFCSDRKSWFKVRDGAYPDFPFFWPYDFNKVGDTGAGINDHNWASAIFALDVNHVRIFFREPQSYVKAEVFECGGRPGINLKSLFPEFAHIFKQVYGSWDPNDREGRSDALNGNPPLSLGCFNQDEYLFIKRFKEMFPKNQFDNEVRMLSPKTAELLKYRWVAARQKNVVSALPKSHRVLHAMYSSLKYDVDFERVKNSVLVRFATLAELKRSKIYMPRVIWWRGMLEEEALQSGYTGLPICFNPANLKSFHNKVGCKKKDGHYVYDNLYGEAPEMCVLDGGRLTNIEDFKNNVRGKVEEDSASIYIRDANEERYHCGEKIAQSVSYHDWSSFSIHPHNFFRSASIAGGGTGGEFFRNMQEMSTGNFLVYLKGLAGGLNMSIQDGYQQMYWHPAEYFTIDARLLANAFNTLMYFKSKSETGGANMRIMYRSVTHYHNDQKFADAPTEKEMMNCALLIWQLSLEKLRNFAEVAEEGYFLLSQQAEKVPVGSFLTSNIVSSALATGCLFLRKLLPGSEIGKFSRDLFRQKDYVPRRNGDKVPVRDDFDTDAMFVPRMFQ